MSDPMGCDVQFVVTTWNLSSSSSVLLTMWSTRVAVSKALKRGTWAAHITHPWEFASKHAIGKIPSSVMSDSELDLTADAGAAMLALRKPTEIRRAFDAVPKPKKSVPENGLPVWHRLGLEAKLPVPKMPIGKVVFSRGKIGENARLPESRRRSIVTLICTEEKKNKRLLKRNSCSGQSGPANMSPINYYQKRLAAVFGVRGRVQSYREFVTSRSEFSLRRRRNKEHL
ncbi:hypothetical protein EVAR_62111_1 [Eumeta japonica]|uniref:Uncharacterized protein n=1 Tax=Eumeta variegata TaxID=151549 RepID=A0A4C1Z5V6_EUMVA|nr:hypothetical protein EVAR_62111_1 [Eumeta japonica]